MHSVLYNYVLQCYCLHASRDFSKKVISQDEWPACEEGTVNR